MDLWIPSGGHKLYMGYYRTEQKFWGVELIWHPSHTEFIKRVHLGNIALVCSDPR